MNSDYFEKVASIFVMGTLRIMKPMSNEQRRTRSSPIFPILKHIPDTNNPFQIRSPPFITKARDQANQTPRACAYVALRRRAAGAKEPDNRDTAAMRAPSLAPGDILSGHHRRGTGVTGYGER